MEIFWKNFEKKSWQWKESINGKTNEDVLIELELQGVDITKAENVIAKLWETKQCAAFLIRHTMWVSAVNFLWKLNKNDRQDLAHLLNVYRQSWIIDFYRDLFDFMDVRDLLIDMSKYQQYEGLWSIAQKTGKKIPMEAADNMNNDSRWKSFLIEHIWDCEAISGFVVSTLLKDKEYETLAKILWKCTYLSDTEANILIRKWFAWQVADNLKSFTQLSQGVKAKLEKLWYQEQVKNHVWKFKDE